MLKGYLNYILISMLLFGCNDAVIRFKASADPIKKGIKFSFFCKRDTTFSLDWNAFQYEEYFYQEEKNLIEIFSRDLEKICKNIEYNQLLLEDEFGNMRFFSNELLLPNESKVWVDIFSISSNISDTIRLVNKVKKTKNWQIRYKSDLMVTENSTKVRFYYLQKVNRNESKTFMLKSNWLKIKDVSTRW